MQPRSAVPTVSDDTLNFGSVGNADIPQGLIIEFSRRSDCSLDLTLATPLRPSICGGTPGLAQPMAVV
jgi:hypothetical protein